MNIEIKKLTPELCDDWLGYFDGIAFGDHGEWALCYCLEGHMTRQANEDLKDHVERRKYAKYEAPMTKNIHLLMPIWNFSSMVRQKCT